jgi:hypothetical protein
MNSSAKWYSKWDIRNKRYLRILRRPLFIPLGHLHIILELKYMPYTYIKGIRTYVTDVEWKEEEERRRINSEKLVEQWHRNVLADYDRMMSNPNRSYNSFEEKQRAKDKNQREKKGLQP